MAYPRLEVDKQVAARRASLAPPGKVWITNIREAKLDYRDHTGGCDVGLYWPHTHLWGEVEVVREAIDGWGERMDGLVALYGVRLHKDHRGYPLWVPEQCRE